MTIFIGDDHEPRIFSEQTLVSDILADYSLGCTLWIEGEMIPFDDKIINHVFSDTPHFELKHNEYSFKNHKDEILYIPYRKELTLYDLFVTWPTFMDCIPAIKLQLNYSDPCLNNCESIRYANQVGNMPVVELLREDDRMSFVDFDDTNRFHNSILEEDNIDVCNVFEIADVKELNELAVLAAEVDNLPALKTISGHPLFIPGYDNNRALEWAAWNGNYDCVNYLLLSEKVKENLNRCSAKDWARMNGHDTVLNLLEE